MPVPILYRDESLIVVDKPAGLLSVPGRGAAGEDNLTSRVQAALGAPVFVVHRLDQATSGLMLLALNAPMQRAVNQAFAERRVDKQYTAVVEGWLADDQGCIDLPLAADWPNRPRQRVSHEDGKLSRTHWQVVSRSTLAGAPAARRTRLSLKPVTGRSHQLRVHLSAIGHPIIGDALYGAPAEAAAPRLMLHASALSLAHPVDGRSLNFASPMPF